MQLATTASMFYACESLKTITFGSEFTTAGVTTMMGMFEDCIFLETIFGINYFTTTQLTTTASMFSGCESLKTITFGSGFTTKKVENMTSMFSGCFSVTTLDLTYFSSTLLLNTNDMFYMPVLHGTPQKSYLMNITFGPNFTCSSVQNMYYMFAYCDSLTALQYINTSGIAVSGIDYWDTSSVQDMTGMFLGDSSLSFTGDLYNKWNVTSIGSSYDKFEASLKEKFLELVKFNKQLAVKVSDKDLQL
jgi:surface protein